MMLALACHPGPPGTGESCACDLGQGGRSCVNGDCGPCACLPSAPATPDPVGAVERSVDGSTSGDGSAASPWSEIPWPTVDALLATDDVVVHFAPGSYDEVQVLRTDSGPHRLVLDGGDRSARAVVAGVTTTEEAVKRSRITVRGFEIADSVSQGVYWEAGDEVILEDLVIHDNGTSPALFFDYASRSGMRSSDLAIRNNHIYDIKGECIYVGGSEGGDDPSLDGLLIERNLVDHCGIHGTHGDDWDGINVKDRISRAVLRENVVRSAHWGYQLDSPVDIDGGLVADVLAEGVMMGGGWGDGFDGTTITDLAVIRAARAGVYVGADRVDSLGLAFTHVTVADAQYGVNWAGDAGISGSLSDSLLTGGEPRRSWGDVDVSETNVATEASYADLDDLAGPDGLYFTADDGYRPISADVTGAAADGGPLGARP